MEMKTAAGSEQGFTLIELMIVLAILGVLAALSYSFMASSRQSAYNISAKHDLKEFVIAQEANFNQYQSYVGNPGESIRNDGIASDFSVGELKISPGVVITVVSGDPADPYNETDPFVAQARHSNAERIYEYSVKTNTIAEK